MTLSLLITFAICFMTGGVYFASYKISKSTWVWYIATVLCSIPSFIKVLGCVG